MASALASPPPVSFGSSDLKRDARRLLERALVISALVHLTGVLLFRSAYERAITRDAEPPVKVWSTPFDVGPKLIPFANPGGSPSTATKGIFTPKDIVDLPVTVPFDFGNVTSQSAEPYTGHDRGTEPGPNPEPPRANLEPPPAIPDILPVPKYAPLPKYPEFAIDAQIEGHVLVRVLVGTDGTARRVIAMDGSKILIAAAVEAVQRWKLEPGRAHGEPVEVWVEIPVYFHF